MSTQAPLKHPDRFFIDGRWTEPSSASTITVTHCATEQPFATVAEAQEADIDRAVAAARKAFDDGPWPRLSPQQRAGYLRKIAAELDVLSERSAAIWPAESGVLHKIAQSRVSMFNDFYNFYAGLADALPFEEERPTRSGAKLALLVREPAGVVAAIVPWNAPQILTTHKCAPALLAGCTVVLKASPEAPGHAYLLAEACEAAGLPPGVLNIVTADRAVSEHLVRHPGVDKVTFTGSTAAGRRIASVCGERIARCTLELGGKSAAVVLDDFDVAPVAAAIAGSVPFLSGQVCSALTRVIVPRAQHDRMVEALSAKFAALKVGDPFDPASEMGPLATRRQRDRVEAYIAKGRSEGATLATGGGRPRHLERGFYVQPTVFGHVDPSSTIAQEEIFGPVVAVIAAGDENEAVAIANGTPYGLNAAVFTNDANRAYAVARRLRSGTVGHNAYRYDQTIGAGGFKQSGIGREGGVEGLMAYLESKTVILDDVPTSR